MIVVRAMSTAATNRVVRSRVVTSVLAMIVAPAMTIVVTSRAVIARAMIVVRAMSTAATNRVVRSPVVTNRAVIVLHAPSVAGATSPVVTNRVVMSRAATNPVATAVTSVPLVRMVAASAWASTKSVRLRRRLARWRLPVRSRRPQQLRLAPRPVRLLLSPVTTSV